LLSAREAEGTIDIVDIFRDSELVMPHVEEAIRIKTRLVWLQLGVVNQAAAGKAHEAGIEVIMDRCLRTVHRQLKRQSIL
jgi:predicted CoA-binding protein